MSKTVININPRFAHFTPFVDSITEEFEKGGKTIYQERNIIKVFEVDGTLINVKRFKVPIFINRIAYTFFRPSKATRSFNYAEILFKKGIYTPEPIATILIYRNGLLHQSYFISLQVPYDQDMYQFGTKPLQGNEHIIKAFTIYTAKLHTQEVYHFDYSPGNILFRETSDGIEFCLVDINRMRFGPVSLEKGCANFARLWGQDDMFHFIAREYALARHADVEQCTKWVFYYRRKFWKRYTKKYAMPFELK